MILYNNGVKEKRTRNKRILEVSLDERPERPKYIFKTNRDRVKFIERTKRLVRSSLEYKSYMSFLKKEMEWDRCALMPNIINGNGKRYSIEIHHEPFSLDAIVNIVLTKYEDEEMDINPYKIAEEVMGLHYDGKVGLIPLVKTMHELVTNRKVFIPLQYIYQDYKSFIEEYEPYMNDNIKQLIEYKIDMSLKCSEIQSNSLDFTFTYLNIEGVELPEVPEEWGKLLKTMEDVINESNSKIEEVS